MTTTSVDRALERVQNLYVMQLELLDLLEKDLGDPVVRKAVRSRMKEFESLLARADWRYMGGMDVWETLKSIPSELAKKLKTSATSPSARRKVKQSRPARATKTRAAAVKRVSKRRVRTRRGR